jgi:hypothetical protein
MLRRHCSDEEVLQAKGRLVRVEVQIRPQRQGDLHARTTKRQRPVHPIVGAQYLKAGIPQHGGNKRIEIQSC